VAADPARCGVAKVIGYSKLRSKYGSHEERRRLCASYDLFLSDDRILPLLPKLLGKAFFKKKKQPVPVDISAAGADWGAAVRKATAGAYFFLSAGGCSAVRCARAAQPEAEVAANVLAAAAGVAGAVPRGWANIRALYLKTSASAALPIYAALPDAGEAASPEALAAAAKPKAAAKRAKGASTAAPALPAPAAVPAVLPKAAAVAATSEPEPAAKKRAAAPAAKLPPAKRVSKAAR